MATTLTAGIVPDPNYSAVSILHNHTANTFSPFSDAPQMPTFPQNPSLDSLSSINEQSDTTQSSTEVIIEALRSKDRLFVLKLGEQMEALITERKARIDLNPATSYQRLLVHRCSAYHKLAPENDPSSKGILVYYTSESKIPSRRISELVPAEETAQPTFKIMRRNFQDRHRLKSQPSHSGSVAGDDADLSDIEPSEAGSQGGRSNTTGSSKRFMTIEEREAAYNKARSRIFMDFEEKEKAKEKDMSASSSTFSLVSGSASTSAGRDSGSVGDMDDSISTAATESEWSGPVAREKVRHSGSGNNSAGSSSRSLRSFNANGGSSCGSRAASPSFSYASLYEPPPSTYEAPQYFGPSPVGFAPPYMYSYPPPPGQAQGQPMMPPYPYYPPYPYHHPQQPLQHPHSDPTSPAGGEGMFPPVSHPHSQSVPYPPPYMWPHGHPPPPPPAQPPPPPQHPQSAPPQTIHHLSATQPPPNIIPSTQNAQYPVSFMPPPSQYGPYSMPYYPPPPPGASGPPHFSGQHGYPHNIPPLMNGTNGVGGMNGVESNQGRRNGNTGTNNVGRRNAPKVRTAWSYGPGPGGAGIPYGGGETVGPRLSSVMRRTSGNSSAGSGGNRTPGDEASSTASSSTTSSSSRRTYTSTSSKHPLPPRPDWAVGLKPQPTLSHHRHHDQNNPNARSSPGHNGMQSQSNLQLPPVFFQSADFPPLSNMVSLPEKRSPAVAGAWTNPSSTRSIMTPAPSNGSPHGSALVHYPNGVTQESYERALFKGNNELFNSKGGKRQGTPDRVRGEAAADSTLVERMEIMALEGDGVLDGSLETTATADGVGSWPGENHVDSPQR